MSHPPTNRTHMMDIRSRGHNGSTAHTHCGGKREMRHGMAWHGQTPSVGRQVGKHTVQSRCFDFPPSKHTMWMTSVRYA